MLDDPDPVSAFFAHECVLGQVGKTYLDRHPLRHGVETDHFRETAPAFEVDGTYQRRHQRPDEQGSEVWLKIDGRMNVNEICSEIKNTSGDDIHDRVSRFIAQLYQAKCIAFRELIEQ